VHVRVLQVRSKVQGRVSRALQGVLHHGFLQKYGNCSFLAFDTIWTASAIRYHQEYGFWSCLQGEFYVRRFEPALADVVEPYGQDRKRKKGESWLLCFLCAQQSKQEDLRHD
jgi:hypothetical protein